MSVEGPSRIPTRREAQRMAATAHAQSVSRSPGTTGTAGVSVRAAGRTRAMSAKRTAHRPTRSAAASVIHRRTTLQRANGRSKNRAGSRKATRTRDGRDIGAFASFVRNVIPRVASPGDGLGRCGIRRGWRDDDGGRPVERAATSLSDNRGQASGSGHRARSPQGIRQNLAGTLTRTTDPM